MGFVLEKEILNILLVTKMLKYQNFMYISSKDFENLNICPFLIKDDELLEKYNEIWEKVSNSIKEGFVSKPGYNEKYLKPKIKLHKFSQ